MNKIIMSNNEHHGITDPLSLTPQREIEQIQETREHPIIKETKNITVEHCRLLVPVMKNIRVYYAILDLQISSGQSFTIDSTVEIATTPSLTQELRELDTIRYCFENCEDRLVPLALALLLWYSSDVVSLLFNEIKSVANLINDTNYHLRDYPTEDATRLQWVLELLICIAEHRDLKSLLLECSPISYLLPIIFKISRMEYPSLNTRNVMILCLNLISTLLSDNIPTVIRDVNYVSITLQIIHVWNCLYFINNYTYSRAGLTPEQIDELFDQQYDMMEYKSTMKQFYHTIESYRDLLIIPNNI